jgi:uncharacterized membrane protein AbrB (regulator of aidB expression)
MSVPTKPAILCIIKTKQGNNGKMAKTTTKAKPALVALTIGLLFSTTSVITAAEAATVKNGVACKKSGQKTKSGKKSYVCGNNPYSTPTKLTWMLTGCLEANDLYIEAKDQYDIFKGVLSASPAGLAELANLQKSMDTLEALMKNTVCKKGS